MKTIHINIFGAPGSGKSTMRSRLFYELKKRQLKVEEIVEIAKDDTYNKRFLDLSDQIQVFGKQHHMHFILNDEVDFIVTDSPFIMGEAYISDDVPYKEELKKLMIKAFNSYNNLNFYLVRDHEYQNFGRNQNEEEASLKGEKIKNFLSKNNIKYIETKSGEEFIKTALDKLGIKD